MANENIFNAKPEMEIKEYRSPFALPLVAPLQTLLMPQAPIGTVAGGNRCTPPCKEESPSTPPGLGLFPFNHSLDVDISRLFGETLIIDDWKDEEVAQGPMDDFMRNGTTKDLDDLDLWVRNQSFLAQLWWSSNSINIGICRQSL